MVIRTDILNYWREKIEDKLTPYEEIACLLLQLCNKKNRNSFTEDEIINYLKRKTKLRTRTILNKIYKLRVLGWIRVALEPNPFFPKSYIINQYIVMKKRIKYELERRGWKCVIQ